MARTYIALDPIRHDGVDYAPGAPIDLDAKAAAALLAVGAVDLPNHHSGSTGESPEASGAAALQADTAPQTSNEAVAISGKPNTTAGGGDGPTKPGAAGAPAAPQPRAPVVPIGSKGGKVKSAK